MNSLHHTPNLLLRAENIHKAYDGGLIPAINGVSLTLEKGKSYALMGPSGCGKSTLLNIIGTLDFPTAGTVEYLDKRTETLTTLHALRRKAIGFVFQFHHLIPVLTLQENVELPLLADVSTGDVLRRSKATALLQELGLGHKKDEYANRVSGGERQRAAIARALINDPLLVLADEPTGSVDSKTAELILEKLLDHTRNVEGTLLIATHDEAIARLADTIIRMKDGRITHVEERDGAA